MHADETTYRVLESETVKTFYWTFLSDKQAKKTITLYHYDPHRSGQLAQATLVGCWAHVRRKFFEAVPPEASNKSISNQGVRYCDRMFALEKDRENLSNQERLQLRQKKLAPLMEEFFDWCRKHKAMTLPNSNFGKAFAYSLNHETTFKHVLLDGRLVLSNNLAERAIKTLVIGRKNWLFSQSFNGAKSSIILSLIETAKRNDLDPEKYLKYLLYKLPNESTLTDKASAGKLQINFEYN